MELILSSLTTNMAGVDRAHETATQYCDEPPTLELFQEIDDESRFMQNQEHSHQH